MNSFLTRGLRQQRIDGGQDWRERMTDLIRGNWPRPDASPRTLQAELGLGIAGEPYYFYVLRAVESFGFVVFVLAESEEAVWPPDAYGATPFDSGGLWWRKFGTSPPGTSRRNFFSIHDTPLVQWKVAFGSYVAPRYGAVSDYIKGNAPASGALVTPGAGSGDGRAWTWEVRVPHNLVPGRLEPRAAFMIEEDRDNYLDWLWRDSSLAERESEKVRQWVDNHAFAPKSDEDVVQATENWMVRHV